MSHTKEIEHSATDSAWGIHSELSKRSRTIEKRRTALCVVPIHVYRGFQVLSMPRAKEIEHSAIDSAWRICSELSKRSRTIDKRRTALCVVLIHVYRGF